MNLACRTAISIPWCSPLNLGHGAPSSQRDAGTKIRAFPWETLGDEVSPLEGVSAKKNKAQQGKCEKKLRAAQGKW